MTAQILSSELTNLIQESKRKNSDLRNAADKSLQELKSLPSTSEAQLAADLHRRALFIDPFIKACGTQNAKFVGPAVVCLQRLIVSRAIPRNRLKEVLESFRETSQLGLDIQLKILQALPTLLQNYSEDIRGELLSIVLQVCSSLQTTKNPAVSGTAAATLQQLIISTFEKVVTEDEKQLQIPTVTEVPGEDGAVSVRPAAHDAYKVFRDICLITEGGRPQSIRFSPITQAAGLELIEAVLNNHGNVFLTHPEQGNILRSNLMPFIIRCLSERLSFPITLRVMRVFSMVLRQHLTILSSECEIALGLLNHMLDPDAAAPWKRAMSMEIFRNVYTDPNLILRIYSQYDASEGKRSIIRDNLSVFVRLSTERPAVIGLGQHSTAPVGAPIENDAPAAQAALEAGAVAGIIGGAPNTASVPGISTQWSTLRIPCMDHLDKSEPPNLPETYIYSLVLSCINNFSESLAKFILPLTVHNEGRGKKKKAANNEQNQSAPPTPTEEKPKSRMARSQSFRRRTVPINPLELKNNPSEEAIKMTAAAIDDCWPAVLATCSTFLNAALDAEYYHALVRSIQKFTQIAGLLRLTTPRDAFLTTMGKAAVPPTVFTANVSAPKAAGNETPTAVSNPKGLLSVDSLVSQNSDKSRRQSMESGAPTLSTRNLLCLRALLNLAIALGPTLEGAWSIIFETLQQADMIMATANATSSGRDRRGNRYDGGALAQMLGSEVSAVQAAASRLFESTVDFPNESFSQVLNALCALLEGKSGAASQPPSTPMLERRGSSFAGISIKAESQVQDYVFALNKIGDIGTLNSNRLISFEPNVSGWDILMKSLVSIITSTTMVSSLRLLATDVLSRLVQDLANETKPEDQDLKNEIHGRILTALQEVVDALYKNANSPQDELDETDVEVHVVVLDAVKSILDQCGDSITVAWGSVFTLIQSVFTSAKFKNENHPDDAGSSEKLSSQLSSQMISTKLGRLAFGSVQLVCSDFLASIPDDAILIFLDLLYLFCDQGEDLNISLTTITFFWNVSDYLHNRIDLAEMEGLAAKSVDVANPDEKIQEGVEAQSIPAMWLHLLLRIASIAHDRRADVRNGTLHTLLRIFDNYGDQLSPTAWNLCHRSITFRLLRLNVQRQRELRSGSDLADAEEANGWVETTSIILNGMVKLFGNYQDSMLKAPRFSELWQAILDCFKAYLTCDSHAVNAVAYDAIGGLLGKLDSAEHVGETAVRQSSQIWLEKFPESKSITGNHEAFSAYVRAFKEVYRLIGKTLDVADIEKAASNLRRCVVEEESTAYSSDKDLLTPLQKEITGSIKMIGTDLEGIPTIVVKLLADLVSLPFTKEPSTEARTGNTFIALCKVSMDLLEAEVSEHIGKAELFAQGALLAALTSLRIPIKLKYEWKTQGKSPPTWQKATSTALKIVAPALENAQRLSTPDDQMIPLWEQIVHIADGIAKADPSAAPSPNVILEDEAFDIKSLTTLRDAIIPGLGEPYIPDSTRRTYTLSLFQNSLIHAPSVGELPTSTLATEPLSSLYHIRHGRTHDPAPTPRTAMAYFCLCELIALARVHDGSDERVKLAAAAAPYLLLRAALPLKAYVADTPLRGRMPQPQPQRQELLFVLGELRALDVEPKCMPDTPGVKGLNKKHLHRLYPLVSRAVSVAGVARRDGEVLEGLVKVVEGVGEGFGV
ncbi:uncharacterized protein K452DRAFT_265191 [Aplosporella prunicola CBS 121167]|uniref:Protein MON2 homolog n=1 Tax=Aplosporella prunicola CBS 121167 TaxID=1176127 RepID=A0A6A6BT83_9PEZI|nr:uncharacterized protein K452DRAFT_265191 [Aplosporella prunicola CBS 121167]KAF2145821.1 hypothetical protein K452DRAFT_265191 [Aplosporella prunicola CBS 121167]